MSCYAGTKQMQVNVLTSVEMGEWVESVERSCFSGDSKWVSLSFVDGADKGYSQNNDRSRNGIEQPDAGQLTKADGRKPWCHSFFG